MYDNATYDISKLDRWVGRASDLKRVNHWRNLLKDFGAALLPFLIDEEYIGLIPEDRRLDKFKKDSQERPSRLFKTYPGVVWVLMAYGDRYAKLPDPFYRDGFLFPLEWRKVESGRAGKHSELLPEALLELADKVKRQFADNGIAAEDFYLRPWHGFRDTVDFSNINIGTNRVDGTDSDFDSAWGALATGLFSIAAGTQKSRPSRWTERVSKWFPCRTVSDGMLANWPFSSIAFDFKNNQPTYVSHLKKKIAIVARYGGNEIAVAPNQRKELETELGKRSPRKIRPFGWEWRQNDFANCLCNLLKCNQTKTFLRRWISVITLILALGVMALGVVSLNQQRVVSDVRAEASFLAGLNYYYGWGVRIDYFKAATNFLFAAKEGHLEAIYKVGWCYEMGLGVTQDASMAVKYYQEAGEKGHLDALCNLAACYERGVGVKQNINEAMKFYRRALEKGSAQAMYKLKPRSGKVSEAVKNQIELWKEDAENGNLDAMGNLAMCYHKGIGVETNLTKAAQLWERAANRGDVVSMVNLALCYENGKGVEKDGSLVVKWYQEAVSRGYANAKCGLGACYLNGVGVKTDEFRAVELFRQSMAGGSVEAICNLGNCYFEGKGVVKDMPAAIALFRQAAGLGSAGATFNLGYCYLEGEGVARDEQKAIMLFRQAADKGDADSMYNLGHCYSYGKGVERNESMAAKWYRKAADMGYALAIYNLAVCYEKGEGVKRDEIIAFGLYQQAAGMGDAMAINALGLCYANGRGVETDLKKAVSSYRLAADKGHVGAMLHLGVCYAQGHGVDKSEIQAAVWWKKAAECGNVDAMYLLGYAYFKGRGIDRDLDLAEKWLRKAAVLGDVSASKLLDRLLKEKSVANSTGEFGRHGKN